MDIVEFLEAKYREQSVKDRLKTVEGLAVDKDKVVFLGMFTDIERIDKEFSRLGLSVLYSLKKSVTEPSSFNIRTIRLSDGKTIDVVYTGYTGKEDQDDLLLALAHSVGINRVNPQEIRYAATTFLNQNEVSTKETAQKLPNYPGYMKGDIAKRILGSRINIYAAAAMLLPKPMLTYETYRVDPIKEQSDPLFNYLGTRQKQKHNHPSNQTSRQT